MLDIRLTFESRANPKHRYHVCAAQGAQWTSMRSFHAITAARRWASWKQAADPLRDVRLLDRETVEERTF